MMKTKTSHIWDDDLGDFARKDFWGVGNGWAVAGITRVIDMLPLTGLRIGIFDILRGDLIDGCVTCQREDGLFHDVLTIRLICRNQCRSNGGLCYIEVLQEDILMKATQICR